jgi:hypothetical protein
MPKKTKPPMSQAEQSRQFEEAARAAEADGGLNPDEAAKAMERALARIATAVPPKGPSGS